MADAVFLRRGEGEVIAGSNREIYVRYEGDEYEVLEFFCEAGFGPIEPHVHDNHTDSFFVIDGEVEFTIGDETVRAGPGTWVAAPPGVRHGFFVPDGAHFLNIHAPGAGFVGRLRQE